MKKFWMVLLTVVVLLIASATIAFAYQSLLTVASNNCEELTVSGDFQGTSTSAWYQVVLEGVPGGPKTIGPFLGTDTHTFNEIYSGAIGTYSITAKLQSGIVSTYSWERADGWYEGAENYCVNSHYLYGCLAWAHKIPKVFSTIESKSETITVDTCEGLVEPPLVPEPKCKITGEIMYTFQGNYPCLLRAFDGTLLAPPARFLDSEYRAGLCQLKNYDGSVRLDFQYNDHFLAKRLTTCYEPEPCVGCQ